MKKTILIIALSEYVTSVRSRCCSFASRYQKILDGESSGCLDDVWQCICNDVELVHDAECALSFLRDFHSEYIDLKSIEASADVEVLQ